jgi:GH15 family glucan-1,4-alpha-glucosidase
MHESEAYTSFIFERVAEAKARKGALPIMFTIRGETDIPEIELTHLDGYRSSQPVRIGNGAASYDQWLSVREITDYVCGVWKETDMSIWEVRGQKQNFVYSKIMMWVAIDRALRLSDKRCFPCPNRWEWLRVRDEICEEVMEKGYNKELKTFIQSYEANEVLDSSILIAPLVFFIAPTDPRFLNTLDRILKPPEKGGLTSTGLVYRYNSAQSDDGKSKRICVSVTPTATDSWCLGAPQFTVWGNSRSCIRERHDATHFPCMYKTQDADCVLGVGGREGAFSMVSQYDSSLSQNAFNFARWCYRVQQNKYFHLCMSFANLAGPSSVPFG